MSLFGTSRGRRKTKLKKDEFKIELDSHVAREVGAVIYFGAAILMGLIIGDKAGVLGHWLNTYLRLIFGVGALALPVIFLGLSAALFFSRRVVLDGTKYLGIGLLLAAGLGMVHMGTNVDAMMDNVERFGGYTGFLSSVLLRLFISDLGAKVVLSIVLVVGVLITFEVSLKGMVAFFLPDQSLKAEDRVIARRTKLLKEGKDQDKDQDKELNIVKPQIVKVKDIKVVEDGKTVSTKQVTTETLEIRKPAPIKKVEEIKIDETDYGEWELPPLDLLSSASSEVYVSDKVLKENAEKIRDKLSQFDIPVTMKDVNIGPTVLQYTLEPHDGVKLTKITALKNDLALALAAKSIRIEAPIPGKALVGIEAPNEKRMVVHLRELIESEEFLSLNSKLRLAVGRDVSGAPVVDDLAAMPHLLIAGATGSGKSVGMNAFLLSLLYQNSPQELKFIMVDPKRVELTSYNGIPHLLTPVITNADKAHAALKWAVGEMNRRYQTFAEKGYRNIEEYNAGEEKKLHKIVIVIDELADLMMQANKKETEALICRIAQMARAIGMHLILATQRPSVDVITGVIKANIPTRIAFTVTSGVDSRTIIDSVGAEDLLGMGDMLYMPGNMSRAVRVQGVYVSSKEIERVTNHVKLTIEPSYDAKVTGEIPLGKDEGLEGLEFGEDEVGSGDNGMTQDGLYNSALKLVQETGKASASLLQRRLSVGYARAARILDIMEEHGVIGPANGAKAREIFVSHGESSDDAEQA